MYGKVTWKLTLPYVKQNLLYGNAKFANGNLLYVSGNSNRVSVSTSWGGMGREVQKGGDRCKPKEQVS